jgi:hypothetical protein
MRQGIAIYLSWRTAALDARAVPPVLSGAAAGVWGSAAGVTGVALTPHADGSQLAAFAVSEAGVGQLVRWHPVLTPQVGAWIVRDEWSGTEQRVARAELAAGIPLDTASADGLALSVRPA